MEVYVDDIMVKGKQRSDHIRNLAETFNILRRYKMKLNPTKCTFGVSSGRFLGYLVTQRGIEAHPKQMQAIIEMKSPTTLKEIQSLTGRAAALNHFLSRSTNRCKPFFKAIKRAQRDKWDEECEKAFQDLKNYLTPPPLLSKPEAAEDLYIYLAVSETYTLTQVPRADNAHADALAGLGSALDHQFKRSIPVEYLDKPSIEMESIAEVSQVSVTPTWQSSIIDYLVNGTLPTERLESRNLQIKSARYYMWNGILVRRSYTGPYLRCLAPPDDLKVLSSIHEGICGNHSGGRSLAQKALNAGYYWPTMHQDAKELVQKYDRCQRYKPVPALPVKAIIPPNIIVPSINTLLPSVE
ncbi:uncharacterized protein LOC126602934 [Malus sylvestris]|uniref:uncharacterized protein LOC126602934 n=1 Tax=Malus sylvestris TaxID=3752 RepID=UPI0021AC915B|nr:uncharacterized protein LOC126602934 [Malus sylvestris]